MKHFVSAGILMGVLMAFTVSPHASQSIDASQSGGAPQVDPGQGNVTKKQAAIPGTNDKRLITPNMNNLERFEMQRDLKKRAAAKRNQLMRQAQLQRQQETANP
jgi:hypothetical protein